jgi:hypothetical protein
VTDGITLPADLLPGDSKLAIGVVEEKSETPVVRLAITDRDQDGWYPLSTLKIVR